MYWNEHKTKSENKDTANEYTYLLESNFIGVNRLFVLIYLNRDNDAKKFKARSCFLPKDIIKTYHINNGKNVYDQPIYSDLKQYEEIKKLTTGRSEDYTTRCLLDYDYTKNHYKLIAVGLSR